MSIGPSLTARDRTQTTETGRTDPEPETTSFALQYAKWSFDPRNTRPCPRMFADKWAADE